MAINIWRKQECMLCSIRQKCDFQWNTLWPGSLKHTSTPYFTISIFKCHNSNIPSTTENRTANAFAFTNYTEFTLTFWPICFISFFYFLKNYRYSLNLCHSPFPSNQTQHLLPWTTGHQRVLRDIQTHINETNQASLRYSR